jgi:hypothetical protein
MRNIGERGHCWNTFYVLMLSCYKAIGWDRYGYSAPGVTFATLGLDGELERVKKYLWHRNVFPTLQVIEGVSDHWRIWTRCRQACSLPSRWPNSTATSPHRYGGVISIAFVESTVNQVISKRFVKKQQMRWIKKGVHLLLQVRTQALNENGQQPSSAGTQP